MKYSWIALLFVLSVSCSQPEPRRPINKTKTSKANFSAELNKRVRAKEELRILQYIEKDTLVEYQFSPLGFAYGVLQSSKKSKKNIFKTSVLTFEKTVYNLSNQLIYPTEKITTSLQGSHMIGGLRDGLKLMQEDDEFKFIFSSFVAHGFSGDYRKIGKNTPIIVKIKLLNINN